MRTNRFKRTREDHSREISEDYLEMIGSLIQECGEARVADLAERLGVSHVTVSKRIARLKDEGLVTALPYRSVFLTEEGREVSDKARERHQLVYEFLVSLGINSEVAEVDAEGIEHHCSEETLQAMTRLASELRTRLPSA